MQGAWVRSLIGELSSHMPLRGVTKSVFFFFVFKRGKERERGGRRKGLASLNQPPGLVADCCVKKEESVYLGK